MKISKYKTRERIDRVKEMIPIYGYFFKRSQEKIRLTDSESQPRYNRANNLDFKNYHRFIAPAIILSCVALSLEKLL